MAAIHGHEDIIELLIQGYKADANMRDFSGKKAKQYLKNSASSRTQQLLLSRRMTSNVGSGRSLDDSFLRSTSMRKSNRARAISSMLQASSSHYIRQPVFSWSGGSTEDLRKTPDSTPPGSRGNSPATRKLASQSFSHHDQKMMPPPPHAPARRKKGFSSSSQETLDTLNEFDTGCTMSKSGSDPSLVAKKQTFI
ncbi:ankyrin repeat domain-containing protein SOWAHC-like [Gigantopelta aegis]|uniref:ankyrin repeat domain-containing protein SOWAHC-like n=1 Tax=Gigantopelta aegis TaxID=1735272 RepID=UPI001B88B31E|nr:ankyrin repeat domain-containing protein SOWAHC-like [Gigantopelta aegis]